MDKDAPCNRKHKKAGVTVLILYKVILKIRNIIRDKGHFIINKLVNNPKCVYT